MGRFEGEDDSIQDFFNHVKLSNIYKLEADILRIGDWRLGLGLEIGIGIRIDDRAWRLGFEIFIEYLWIGIQDGDF